ncbi:MAG: hypothetical protein CMJ58_08065 [Planctomycetaceae bacterium]|nr:hypothetical protein [Planctomycetaceae bacterium]
MPAAVAASDRPLAAPARCASFTLRAVGGGAAGALALSEGKFTLGSSRRCDLQLAVPGVRPLHCVITVAGDEIRANRWAPGVLLNGSDFVESPLAAGDRLTLGGCELELAAASSEPSPTRAEAAKPVGPRVEEPRRPEPAPAATPTTTSHPAVAPTSPAPLPTLTHWRDEDRLLARLWSRNYENRSRVHALVSHLRTQRRENARLRNRLTGLSDDLATTHRDLDAARAAATTLQRKLECASGQNVGENQRLTEQLAAERQRAEGLERQTAELTAELRQQAARLAEREAAAADAAAAVDALARAEQTIADQRQQLTDLQAEYQRSQADARAEQTGAEEQSRLWSEKLAAAEQRAEELSGTIERLENQLAERDADLARHEHLAADAAAAADLLAAKEAELARQQEEVARLQAGLETARSEASGGDETVDRLHGELADAERRAAELAARVATLESELRETAERTAASATEEEQAALRQQQQIESLQNDLATARTAAAQANDVAARLQDQLAAAEAKAESLAEQIEQLETQLNEPTDDSTAVEAAQREAEAAAASLAAAEQLLDEHHDNLARLQADLDSARDEASAAQAEVDRLSASQSQLQSELVAAQARIEELADTATEPNEDLTALQTQLDDMAEQRDVAQDLLRECEAQVLQLTADLQQAREQLQDAASRGESAAHDDAQLEAIREQLAQQVAAAESAVANAETRARDAETRAAEAAGLQESLTLRIEQLEAELAEAASWHANPAGDGSPDVSVEPAVAEPETPHTAAEEAIEHLRAAAIWKDEEPAEPGVAEPDVSIAVQEPVQEPSEPATDEAPSFLEQYRHLLEEDDADPTPVESVSADFSAPEPSLTASECEDDDDAALQAYMDNMMRRVRGEPNVSTEELLRSAAARPVPTYTPSQSAVPAPAPAAAPVEPAEPLELIDLDELKKSTKKPALPADISAMRELANSSARTAIAKHRKKRLAESAMGRFAVGAIAIGLAIYLMLSAEWIGTTHFVLGALIAVGGAWATGTVAAFAISEFAERLKLSRATQAAETALAKTHAQSASDEA